MANSLNSSGMLLNVGMRVDTAQAKQHFNTTMKMLQKDAQIRLTIDGTDYTKTIKTYRDQMGNLIQTTTLWNHATSESKTYVTKLTTEMERFNAAEQKAINATNKLSAAQNSLNNHVKQSKTLFNDFVSTFAKMAKFNTINLIYDGMINKMSEAIQITNDFDAAMTEFKKVTDTTGLSLTEYTNTLGELGEATARTTTQMLESATEFSKAGFTPEESARLAQVASLYQNIADAEISAGEAASFITSQIKAFKDYGVEVNNATQIIDKLNEVSNNYSVSSTDIASALTKQSASLAAYGNDLNESIALVTAGTEIMTGQAGKVARGLRTIGANITQLAQNAKEFDITVNGATKTIQLWNETGTDMLDTYNVLKQISAEWDNMTNAEKSSLAITLAKKTQMDTFLAVLGNFEDAEKAYTTALLSEGSAWKENEKYMESIEAHQAKLKQQWEQLVLSKPIEDLEKALLDAGTALLKFANSDLGQAIAKATALVTVIGLLVAGFSHLSAIMLSAPMGTFLASVRMLIAGTTTLTAVTNALTTALLSNPLFWGAVAVAGIAAIGMALDALIVTYDEQIEKLNEATEAYKNAQSELDGLQSKLTSLSEAKDALEAKKSQTTNKEQLKILEQQTNELERQEASLNRQLALAKAKAQTTEDEAKKQAERTLKKEQKVTITSDGKGTFLKGTPTEILTKEISEMEKLQKQIIENNKALDELTKDEIANEEEIKSLAKENGELVEKFNQLQTAATDSAETLSGIVDILGDEKGIIEPLLDKFADFVGWDRQATDANSGLIDSTENLDEEIEETTEDVQDLSDAYSEFFDGLEDIQSAYETLTKAADEYNQNGSITAATLKKLNKLSPEYLAALQSEGGQYLVNVELLEKLYKAEQQDAIQKLELAKDSTLCKLANEYLTESTDDVTTAVTNSGNEAKNAIPKFDELTEHVGNAAIKLREVHDYLVGGEGDDSSRWEQFKQQWDETSQWFDQQIENVKNSNIGLVSSSKSAASSHKDAWVEAFEEEQRQLKHSLEMNEITEIEYYEKLKALNEKYFGEASGQHQKYLKEYQENEEEIYKGLKSVYDKVRDYLAKAVENGYEKAIKALQKEEKKVLDDIKKTIEALKKEKSSVLDNIKDEIDSLKKQKENVQKYYNDQIDAIKKENEVLEEQNQLLEYQQALQQAKAQKVMVMQGGKFQLGENESAVAQAEQNLGQYQDQLSYEQQIQQLEDLRDAQVESIEARIESLEEYYDYMEEYYDKQIEAMEEYRDRVQEEYDARIEALQTELDTFKEGLQREEDLEDARLANQVLGINERANLYEQDLANLQNYINSVNAMLAQLGDEGATVSYSYTPLNAYHDKLSSVSAVDAQIATRASGDASFKKDGIALVGESPNTELVLGSRANKLGGGQLLNLSKGSGVVNAESTQTLAGLLNTLAQPQAISNSSRSMQQTFNFGSISLPNVTNAESFVGALRDKFNNYAIQYSTIKR